MICFFCWSLSLVLFTKSVESFALMETKGYIHLEIQLLVVAHQLRTFFITKNATSYLEIQLLLVGGHIWLLLFNLTLG